MEREGFLLVTVLQFKVFTTSYALVVEHHSLVAAELVFLHRDASGQN